MVTLQVLKTAVSVHNDTISAGRIGMGDAMRVAGKTSIEVVLTCHIDGSDKGAVEELQHLLASHNLIANLESPARSEPPRQTFFEGTAHDYTVKDTYKTATNPDVPEASKGTTAW